jgi:SRSO17 transposase
VALTGIAEAFQNFCREFTDMFVCHRRDNSVTAYRYLCGLIQSERGNMERMEESVADTDYNALQQFISDSPWSARTVFNRVAVEASTLLGGTGETALIIDESGFAKKGRSSVGVSRQWNGRLGKVDNSQVAVFGALSAGERVVPIDVELFLPKEWTDDPERCVTAGVPEEAREHRSKAELAWEIVQRQRELGVCFDYVCGDGLYGNSPAFCRKLDDSSEVFLMHVHSDQHVYFDDPQPVVPPRRSSRGRTPSRLEAQCDPIRVDALKKRLKPADWEHVVVRETTAGPLEVDIHRRQVWVWDGEEKEARSWQLVIRRDRTAAGDIKYCLTNAKTEKPTVSVARMEAQRFWIERAFEGGKSEVSMAYYQVRNWTAWHHHMALVIMAMLFMTRYRMQLSSVVPLLSCHDIRMLLAHFLPRGNATSEDVLTQLERRHRKRRSASESIARRRLAFKT